MEAISFLDGISGYVRNSTNGSADKGIRLAVIDPAYNPTTVPYPAGIPLPRVTFEGETTLSGKTYAVAQGYVPAAGDRVWMVPIGNSWLIAGAASHRTAQGFYAENGGTQYGVELGGGSYFDSDSGLVLLTDADVAGDLSVDGIGKYLHKRRKADGPGGIVNTTTLQTDSVLFLDLDIGDWELNLFIAYTSVGGDIATNWNFTGTWSGLKFCFGISPFAINTATVNDTPSRDSSAMRSSVHQLTTTVPYGANDSSNFAGLHEHAGVTVTVAGRFSFQYTQRVANAAQVMIRNPSFITARRVG